MGVSVFATSLVTLNAFHTCVESTNRTVSKNIHEFLQICTELIVTADTLTYLAVFAVAVVGMTSAGVAVCVRTRAARAVVLTRATIARVTHWNNKDH